MEPAAPGAFAQARSPRAIDVDSFSGSAGALAGSAAPAHRGRGRSRAAAAAARGGPVQQAELAVPPLLTQLGALDSELTEDAVDGSYDSVVVPPATSTSTSSARWMFGSCGKTM